MRICKSTIFCFGALLLGIFFAGCNSGAQPTAVAQTSPTPLAAAEIQRLKNPVIVIHVIVALCDNENQGIVPVPASLGNGSDPDRNLYWGAAYGVSTFFGKSELWTKIEVPPTSKKEVLRRIGFRHKKTGAFLIADAYQGSEIKTSLKDFLKSTSGNYRENIVVDKKTLQIGDSANVLVYVGHNGLMDFKLEKPETNEANTARDTIILACFSKRYFKPLIADTKTKPLVWTTNFMAPEAYILHDALEGRLSGETDEQVRNRAAKAYAKFQRISIKSARGLLVTG